jgi:hypothetical protein
VDSAVAACSTLIDPCASKRAGTDACMPKEV